MLMRTDVATMLRQHHLFAALDDAQFERIARTIDLVQLDEDGVLFQPGDPARHFYVVISGVVKLGLQSPSGEEKIVEIILPGQSFAEALMFMEAPMYPIAAIALERSTVAAMSSAEFLAVLRASSETCLRLLADISRRLHARIQEIESLTLQSARHRLVHHLLSLAAPATRGTARIELEESRQMLASLLSVKPETLSRLLRTLQDERLLVVDGRTLVITDLEQLCRWI